MTQAPVKIALVMGDAAGIGAELAAKLLAQADALDAAGVLVLGDEALLAEAAATCGLRLDLPVVRDAAEAAPAPGRPVFLDLAHNGATKIARGVASAASGAFAMRNFGAALDLAKAGAVDAVCFTPFNKEALKLAGNPYNDEIHWAAERLGFSGRCSEFNRLGDLWSARVTSHIPLAEVSRHLTREEVTASILDAHETIGRAMGKPPRLAVAGLNPHAGEGGLFGREEMDVIRPAIEDAAARGVLARGPYPADTVWLRARKGEFDGIVTMYHDQGQIALKLLGFDRGVTILGGLPVPITTPAHGSAYDIAGRGAADPGATRAAFDTAVAMAGGR